ncbi:hypothetical protein AA313_de0207743 [Arthrobotrys entomopaga]|nr:hypothetical protein AA313_de0207743 [Arthrobotrys entomopaga]
MKSTAASLPSDTSSSSPSDSHSSSASSLSSSSSESNGRGAFLPLVLALLEASFDTFFVEAAVVTTVVDFDLTPLVGATTLVSFCCCFLFFFSGAVIATVLVFLSSFDLFDGFASSRSSTLRFFARCGW